MKRASKKHYKKICALIVAAVLLGCNTGVVFATQDVSNQVSGNATAISENAKTESGDVIPQVSSSMVSENSDEVPIEEKTISEDNAGGESEEPAGINADWYKDYDYTLDNENHVLILNYYKGDSRDIAIPEKACISVNDTLEDYSIKIRDKYAFRDNPYHSSGYTSIKIGKNVEMPSDCCGIFSIYELKSVDISSVDTSKVTSMESMFFGCRELEKLDLSNWDTCNVTKMQMMFDGCEKLANLDLININTSNVTDMHEMFRNCTNLTNLDITNFDTSNVENMYAMFANCKNLTSLNLRNFNTSNVTRMDVMFGDCSNLRTLDLTSFNTSKVDGMRLMFSDCTRLASLDLSSFDMSAVTDSLYFFQRCESLYNIKTPKKAQNISLPSSVDGKNSRYHEFLNGKILDKVYTSITLEDPGHSIELLAEGYKSAFDFNEYIYRADHITGRSETDLKYTPNTVSYITAPLSYDSICECSAEDKVSRFFGGIGVFFSNIIDDPAKALSVFRPLGKREYYGIYLAYINDFFGDELIENETINKALDVKDTISDYWGDITSVEGFYGDIKELKGKKWDSLEDRTKDAIKEKIYNFVNKRYGASYSKKEKEFLEDMGSLAASNVGVIVKNSIYYAEICNMSESKIAILKEMRKNTKDKELIEAIDFCVLQNENAVAGTRDMLNKTVGDMEYEVIQHYYSKKVGNLIKERIKNNPEAMAVFCIYEGTKLMLNTDDVTGSYYKISAMAEVTNCYDETYRNILKSYDGTEYSAIILVTATDLLFSIHEADMETYGDLIKACLPGYCLGDAWLRIIFPLKPLLDIALDKNTSYTELRNGIEEMKQKFDVFHYNADTLWITHLNYDYPGTYLYQRYEKYRNNINKLWKKEIDIAANDVVDITVKDSNFNNVCCASNRTVSASENVSIYLEDGVYHIILNDEDDYTVTISGNAGVKTDLKVTEYRDGIYESRSIQYDNINIGSETGCTINLNAGTDGTGTTEVTDAGGTQVSPAMDTKTSTKHSVSVNGGIAITSISCGSLIEACEGQEVELVAEVPTGYDFAGWSVQGVTLADSTSGITTFTMTGTDAVIRASFVRNTSEAGKIELDKDFIVLSKNEAYRLTATVLPEDTINKTVVFSSEDENTATVDSTGLITAISGDYTNIIAETADGSVFAKCYVSINAPEESGGNPNNPKPNPDPIPGPNPGPNPDPDKPVSDDEIPENAPSSGIWVKGLKQEFAYTGTPIKPEIKVYDGRTRLYENKDYTLKYKNNTKPGTAYAVLTMKGNYSGSQDVPFTIRPASLITDISADAVYAAYKKNKTQKLKPELYVGGQKLKYGKNDLTFTYPSESVSSNSKPYSDMGTWKIHIAANNTALFTGEQDVDLVIVNKPVMSAVSVKTSKSGLGYTGSPVTPVFTVKYKGKSLTQGTDYTVIYKDAHTDIGNHMVVLKGNNKDYFGSKTVTFKISGKYDLASAKGGIEFDKASLNADGSVPYTYGGAKPAVIVKYDGKTLTAGKDYTVSYKNNKALGTATATVKGKGSYKGSPTKTFEIKQRDINTLSLNIADKLYSSKSDAYKKPPIVFTDGDYKNQKLKKDTDYTVEYSGVSGNAPVAGSKILVTLQGKGNYNGTINTSYMIIDKDYDFTKAKVTVNGGKAYAYTGKAITPAKSDLQVSIKNKGSLGEEDYDIIGYYNNVKKGNSAYIKLRGKGKYSGVKMVKFKIGAAPMESEWSGVIMNLRDAFAW